MTLSLLLVGTLSAAMLGATIPALHASRVTAAAGGLSQGAPSQVVDTLTLHIEGMTCGGCTLATRKVLEKLDGVTKAEVSYEQKRAVVTYDPSKVTVEQMIAAIATLKYKATLAKP